MTDAIDRRTALLASGLALATGAAALSPSPARAEGADLTPPGASTLRQLTAALARAPRRRDFRTVPMILDDPSQWDHQALTAVMAYRGAPRQAFDNTDIATPWLNVMRNALNGQIWSFRHPDCLVVSATHGTAHLALYDQATWDRYRLSALAGAMFTTNTLILEAPAGAADPANYQNPRGAYSPPDSTIPALQRRGVVFLACHNAIWEVSGKLIATGVNPDRLSQEAMAAELTNHLIPGVVLTPGIVATLPELQRVGFFYNK